MTRQSTFLLLGLFACAPLFAQKTFQISKLDQTPTLDGALDDNCWQKAGISDNFSTSTPVFGQTPAHLISVRMFYADDAIYIGATFGAEHLRDDGSARDAFAGDWFSASFDTWNNDQHAFSFAVTAGGAQIEHQIAGPKAELDWDAVWQSAVARRADGWSVEMRIPFTALRFPKGNTQNWGVQFSRYDVNTGELCTWNPQNPVIDDRVLQYGDIEGLENIHQAQRRRLSAYSANRHDWETKDIFNQNDKFLAFALGVDAQVGIGSNTTLDFTVLPTSELFVDLRENRSDPTNLNLLNGTTVTTPRQLNAESAPLFNRGEISWPIPELNTNYLLQRVDRIGPGVIQVTRQNAKVLNVARLNTRTRRNFGFGVYNALLGPAGVILRDNTGAEVNRVLQPLSNYTMLTAEKVLRNNSWINLSNATLLAGPLYKTNISAADIRLRDRSNTYEIAGNGQLAFRETAPDTATANYQYRVSVAKSNGAWRWRIGHSVFSETIGTLKNYYYQERDYDILRTQSEATVGYLDFKPGKRYLNRSVFLRARKDQVNPVLFTATAGALTPRFRRWAVEAETRFVSTITRIYTSGSNFLERRISPEIATQATFQSDVRKRFYYSILARFSGNIQGEASFSYLRFDPNWVINRHFSIRSEHGLNYGRKYLNYLNGIPPGYYFNQFDALTAFQTLELNWYPGSRFRMWAQSRLSTGRYLNQQVVQLLPDRSLVPADYPFEPYPKVARWTAAFGLQYLFAPGSQLRFSHQFLGDHFEPSRLVFPGVYQQNGLKEMQTTLSIILLIDPPNKRNFVGHE